MREIKFRAWIPRYELMVDVLEINWEKDNICRWDEETEHYEWYNFNEIYLMQFTGLHDKNGKEIYMKDIVERRERTVNGEIDIARGSVYQHESGRFMFEGKDVFGERRECVLYHNLKNTEVIGNIYENPELLNNES